MPVHRPLAALEVDRVTKVFRRGRIASLRNRCSRSARGRASHSRPAAPAVDDVSFAVRAAEIYGVIGANGSGKSTLIRMISTLLLPDSGAVRVFGHDVVADAMAVRGLLNRVSADPSFFKNMSALENLLFFGRAYGMAGSDVRRRSQQLLGDLGMDGKLIAQPMVNMSRGQQQKVAVARAFLTSPRLLLLDEPTTGLDPRSKRDVQRFVSTARAEGGVTILLTTHDMTEAELLCDRMAFLARGRIVAEDTPLELRRQVAGTRPVDEVDMEAVFMSLTGHDIADDEEREEVSHGRS